MLKGFGKIQFGKLVGGEGHQGNVEESTIADDGTGLEELSQTLDVLSEHSIDTSCGFFDHLVSLTEFLGDGVLHWDRVLGE